MCAARRHYLCQLAAISKRRQALLQQLQEVARPLTGTNQEIAERHLSLDDILQQMQLCSLEETNAFIGFNRTLGHKVMKFAYLYDRLCAALIASSMLLPLDSLQRPQCLPMTNNVV